MFCLTKTINDVYMQLFHRFKKGGDPMPSLTARELTAYACKADKNHTAGGAHSYIDDTTVDYANLLCDRCLDGEPLAYILGEWDFYGLTFKVDRSVLIPRSDTERLCELVIEQAKKRVSPRILDLCCGSGCIGIAAAHAVEDARVTAIDLSEGALHITRENARTLGVSSRVFAMHADVMQTPPHGLGQFDIIVSNPPYVTGDEMQALDRSVADFEPHEALYGGEDGLDFYHAICDSWGERLVPGGRLLFECGWHQADEVAAIMREHGYADVAIAEDFSGVPRIVYGTNTRPEVDLTREA